MSDAASNAPPLPAPPLIVTAVLDAASQARFERERRQYFPPSLNRIPAHVTLFHALPGAEEANVVATLRTVCAATPAAPFTIAGVRFLGRGVAYTLHMPAIERVRALLAAEFHDTLTPQDRQKWQPHVTVQNKAPPEDARRLHATLMAGFVPREGHVEGLALWRYLGGPWEAVETAYFRR